MSRQVAVFLKSSTFPSASRYSCFCWNIKLFLETERERDLVYFVAALTACRNGRQQYSDDEGSADVSLPVTTDGRSVRRRNGKNASSLRRLPRL